MNRAFTLVELSIVLVILGLITGGILAGQSLIKSAELTSIIATYQRYTTATHSFIDKYDGIPGDLTNATHYWGRLNSNADCVTNVGAAVTTPGTCDGDGDGQIAAASAASKSGEIYQFWRQLALAGLIEGNYTGIAGSTGPFDHDIGINAPASKNPQMGWSASWINNATSANNAAFAYDYTNYLNLGTDDGVYLDGTNSFTPAESWNIDKKIDDGAPGTGYVQVFGITTCTNAASTTDTSTTYKLTTTSNACALVFRNLR